MSEIPLAASSGSTSLPPPQASAMTSPAPMSAVASRGGVVKSSEPSGTRVPPQRKDLGRTGKAKPRKRRPNEKPVSPKYVGGVGNQKLMHLIVDSGAIIKGAGMTLANAAENFWTIPEVVAEIRDKKARHHLQTLPFELKLREPSDDAMKFAANFARQTGDLRSLSRVDLKVIALAYMLERQETGAAHLRTKPVRPGTKVDVKKKGIATTTLTPEAPEQKTSPKQSAIPITTSQVPARGTTLGANTSNPTDAVGKGTSSRSRSTPSSASEKPQRTGPKGEDEDEDASVMDSLCAAVKQAWIKDVADSPGVANEPQNLAKERGGGEHEQENGESQPVEEGEDVADRSVGDEEQGECSDGEETDFNIEQDSEIEEEDEDEDEEWEPADDTNNNSVVEGGKSETKPSVSFAAPATVAEAEKASFDSGDFPALGAGSEDFPVLGTSGGDGERDAAASTVSLATAATSPDPPASSSSWSLMARSNPAPFKATVRQDPAPLPAAALTPEDESNAAEEFGGASAAGARSAASNKRPDGAAAGSSRILSTASGFGVTSGAGKEEDDGEGWVNPSNIKSRKMVGLGLNGPSQSQRKGAAPGAAAGSKCRAGCVTTDFAMQNVILQVGLPLLSLDGMAVSRIKQWILRCSACFKTCTEMGRLFCPVCGNANLNRVACSVDANTGETRVHLRRNHKVNLRGTKFSIPGVNPAKGRFEGDLLLREDQLLTGIWAQKARRKEKDISSMFGEDITGNVGLTVSKSADIVVGYGRKNPNATRGRERRGKKSVKKRL